MFRLFLIERLSQRVQDCFEEHNYEFKVLTSNSADLSPLWDVLVKQVLSIKALVSNLQDFNYQKKTIYC